MARKLATVLVATALAAGGATGAAAAPVAAPAAADPTLDLAHFELRPNRMGTELKDRVALLDAELPNVGVASVMTDANRAGQAGPGTCNDNAVGSATIEVVQSLCFNSGDNSTALWYPQGVTTIADAQDDKEWGDGNHPILISWYDSSTKDGVDDAEDDLEKGVRISFMDPTSGQYRHVLLVYPTINSYGNPSYMSVRTEQTGAGTSLHAGGIVWYGNFLYVADTGRGFRVFDMRHIYDLGAADNGTTQDRAQIGRRDGVYHGHGYRYVMPQVASWTSTAAKAEKCGADSGALRFSYAGLDRSGLDHMTAGEYCAGPEERNGRVAAWPMAGAVRDGEQITDTSYRWQADAAHKLPDSNIQGAVRFDDRWYLSRSRGSGFLDNGDLYRTTPADAAAEDLRIDGQMVAAIGPEDLSHWEDGRGGTTLGAMWTVAEHPNKRMVYSVRPARSMG
ncbi:hypothetical protein [Saccharopolyspora cebuensis]|uniref:Secreted protein n=1 Tax=Saccharopolyspora cebuensis TaxID=418759 RepID=A0ABV4CQV3_9PSEU